MEFRKNQKTKKLIYSSYRNLYISNLFHQVSKYSCETYMKPIFLKILNICPSFHYHSIVPLLKSRTMKVVDFARQTCDKSTYL